jgi:hypothetical protein
MSGSSVHCLFYVCTLPANHADDDSWRKRLLRKPPHAQHCVRSYGLSALCQSSALVPYPDPQTHQQHLLASSWRILPASPIVSGLHFQPIFRWRRSIASLLSSTTGGRRVRAFRPTRTCLHDATLPFSGRSHVPMPPALHSSPATQQLIITASDWTRICCSCSHSSLLPTPRLPGCLFSCIHQLACVPPMAHLPAGSAPTRFHNYSYHAEAICSIVPIRSD